VVGVVRSCRGGMLPYVSGRGLSTNVAVSSARVGPVAGWFLAWLSTRCLMLYAPQLHTESRPIPVAIFRVFRGSLLDLQLEVKRV
jgi:hypothetical protein